MNKTAGRHQNDESIKVTVRLLANLSKYAPDGNESFSMTVYPKETVKEFLERFSIPIVLEPVVVINGRPGDALARFSDGDDVLIFEPVTGG